MTRAIVWISYDLGVQGDYQGLFTWLDEHEARECGDSLASVKYEYSNNLIEEVTSDLLNSVHTTSTSRIYVIYRGDKLMKGRFIVGGRRAAPWQGYAQRLQPEDSEDE